MSKFIQRLQKVVELFGLAAFCTLVAALIVSLRHKIDTPQPLESILPGEAHIYRWRLGHIFYKTLGDEHAPPLVLLHAPAIAASSYEMRKVMGALAQKYHVYAPDLPGFGLSDRPHRDYSAETYIDFCHDFLTEVVQQPATVLASGLSCNYAVIAAKYFPAICVRLILVSPMALFTGKMAQQRPRATLLKLSAANFFLYPIITSRTALRFALSRKEISLQGQISKNDVEYLYATTHQFGAEHAPLALLSGKLAVDASQEFDSLPQPTLVIWGARALHNSWSTSSNHPISDYVEIALIQDAGASVHEQYPAMVVENIRAWSEVGKTSAKKPAQHKTTSVDEKTMIATEEETAGEKTIIATEEETAAEKSNAAAQLQQSYSGETQPTAEANGIEVYCARCKKKTVMQNVEAVTMKNGKPGLKGTCSICGSGQFRIGRL